MSQSKKRKLQDCEFHSEDNVANEVEECDTPKSSKRLEKEKEYQKYFTIEPAGKNMKIGVCKECAPTRGRVEVKMKDSNTIGLLRHLQNHHSRVYEALFGKPTAKSVLKFNAPNQKSLDSFVMVNENQFCSKTSNLCSYFFQGKKVEGNWGRRTAVWVAYKRLPISFFDDEVTQKFFGLLNPSVAMPKKNPMRHLIIREFENMQKDVQLLLQNVTSRISFTVDGWTAPNSRSCYGVTAHFLNHIWNPIAFALDLIPSQGQHKGRDIAKVFFECIKFYGIHEKIGGITLDNAASNTTFIKELGTLLMAENIEFNTEDQHFFCFAHVLNLAVQDLFTAINVDCPESIIFFEEEKGENDSQDIEEEEEEEEEKNEGLTSIGLIISKIRKTFRKIKNTEDLLSKLEIWCSASEIKFLKPKIDVKTRWNSTSIMIDLAFRLRVALMPMWTNIAPLKKFKISSSEWQILEFIRQFLQHFTYLTNLLSAEKKTTLPVLVVAINMLLDKIEKIISEVENLNYSDEQVLLMNGLRDCRDKILKHYDKTNWIYCVAMILDPRHKYGGFDTTEWGRSLKDRSIKAFRKLYKEKYYTSGTQQSDRNEKKNADLFEFEEMLSSIYVQEKSTESWDAEIDDYISTPRATFSENILSWWKTNEKKYLFLSQMAKDILGIQATSVPVERFFSIGSQVMTDRRTRLKDDAFRALMCINSWTKSEVKSSICQCPELFV